MCVVVARGTVASMPALPRSDASSIDADKLASEISRDIESDFIIAPHLSAVLKMSGADFVRSVLRDLGACV